jgi:hypothetical protein
MKQTLFSGQIASRAENMVLRAPVTVQSSWLLPTAVNQVSD